LSHEISIVPSAFVATWIERLRSAIGPDARALDLAMGRGRHAVLLARAGYRVFGVDVKPDAIRSAMAATRGIGSGLRAWCADLMNYPLPRDYFDLVVVTRYLQRDLFAAIRNAVVPGGIVVYETFTIAQRALGTGPASRDHLLEPGELRAAFDAFEVLDYEETDRPEALARIAARRRA
jgi:tellurite methyltransferase